MRNFHTTALERLQTYDANFETEPYETGWASEAMFFVQVHQMSGTDVAMSCYVQVSVDGIEWIDEGTALTDIRGKGNSFIRVKHFGGWLRLANKITGATPAVKLTIQLVLKE